MKSKTWVLEMIGAVILVLAMMCLFIYTYDPYSYFRLTDNNLKSTDTNFINPGIAKHAEYDTVIIGSSMVQNFNMETFRKRLNWNPIKLATGSMSNEERALTLSVVTKAGKAKIFIFNIDIATLNNDKSLGSFPTYLYDDDPFNDYKYLLGFEAWMRVIPSSIAISILDKLGIYGYSFNGNVDHVGEWWKGYHFGSEILIAQWQNHSQQVSTQNLNHIEERLTANADTAINDIIQQCKDKKVIIFFPPYSALYWYEATQDGYIDAFQDTKKYIVSKVEGLDNVTVYDFQSTPTITNLDYYKDPTHYSPYINDLMVEYMAEKSYVVNVNNIDVSIRRLHELLNTFTNNNINWLVK